MSDDLLEQLGRLDRQARPAAPWDEVLEGRRSASEVVEQLRPGADDEDELEALAEASRPLDAAERSAWTRRLRAALDEPAEAGDDPSSSEPEADAVPDADADAEDREDAEDRDDPSPSEPEVPAPIPLEPARRRATSRSWRWGAVSAAVAAAAAVVLWLRAPPPPDGGDAAVAMPGFSLEIRNDTIGEIRGASPTSEAPPRYEPRSNVNWMVRPAEPVATGLELALLVEDDGDLACLRRPPIERASADGVFQLRGTVQHVLGLAPGRWSLSFIVAPTGSLPADPPGGECMQPRTVPCPCPPVVQPAASIEPAQPPARAAEPPWVRVEPTYTMVVETP